jgi:hypothetical protein
MPVQYGGDKITFSDGSTVGSGWTGMKNRIINGAMTISQRNGTSSVTITSDNTYTLDRWQARMSQSSKFSVQQNAGSVTPPTGFTNYLGVTSLATTSLGADDFYAVAQYVEGFNAADLGWGSASASPVTISFWVRSSLTGTFGGNIGNGSGNRAYPFTYTISAANTWEQKSVTIAGDTTGTWAANNTTGICIFFGLGVGTTYSGTAGAWAAANRISATGATSVVGTNGATFYITGVQLEKGSTATSFDYRPYGTEVLLCQRYYQTNQSGVGKFGSSTSFAGSMALSVPLRTTPTTTLISGTGGIDELYNTTRTITAAPGPYSSSTTNIGFSGGQFVCDCSGATSGAIGLYIANKWAMSAEL